jgi:hypothetical protein
VTDVAALAQSSPTPAATPVSPLYPGATRVYVLPPPYAQTATMTGAAGAALSLQLPNVSGFTTVLYRFDLSCGAPAATENGVLTISNIRGQTETYEVAESASTGALVAPPLEPLEASGGKAAPAPITFAFGAVTGGSACALNAYYGFKD